MSVRLFSMFLAASIFFYACAALPHKRFPADIEAVQSAVSGIPVPAGSELDADGLFEDDQGVVMAFYTHPSLAGEQVLRFYDAQMPIWGWTAQDQGAGRVSQRAYSLEGVHVLIGVDKTTVGCRFSILKGAHGDWRFMAPLRGRG